MKTELDYLEQGSGDAVFLLHSTAAGNKQWRKLIDELSPHFKVIAPNLIGGKSALNALFASSSK
jgi:esterase/lipase